MTEWFEKAYPGGTMVAVPGFPRPLYFPGNPAGKPPSADGPDVMAYKRVVSRLGRWPWTPNDWDYAFSKNFATGKAGGNVSDSGVAGCQRQQPELDPETGQIGEATFNFFRAARIPTGLPNAGQTAFDTTALNLIGEAWQIFKGNPTPPPPATGSTLRQKALKAAQGQIGVKESPANSNQCKFTSWYGLIGPWCAMFCTWAYETQGDSPAFVKGSRYAYVPYIVSDAQNGRYGLSLTSSPISGDLVCYDWDGGDYDHVGIFESGNSSSWNAVEGNTSTSNNSNGGEVMRRSRSKSQAAKIAFVRVREP